MKSSIAIFLLLFFLAACKEEVINSCYRKDLRSINFGFETTLEDWVALGGSGERKFDSDIQISTETSSEGTKSVKFTISPESYVNNGIRSELTFDQQIEDGDETTYEYSLFIPSDYQDVNSLTSDDGAPNWQLMGQWHDKPDSCAGETWDSYIGSSPPVGIYYNFLTNSDPAYQQLLADPQVNEIYGMDTTWNDVSVLSVVYNYKTIAMHKIGKGDWIKLKLNIKWSTSENGSIEVWINDGKFTDGKVTGRNMLNKASHYFKFGLYRNPDIPFTNTLYYDDIRIY